MADPIQTNVLYRVLVGTGFLGLAGMTLSGVGKICDVAYRVMKNGWGLFFDQFRDEKLSTPLETRFKNVQADVISLVYSETEEVNNKTQKNESITVPEHVKCVLQSPVVRVAAAMAMIPLLKHFGGPCPELINRSLGYLNVQVLGGPISNRIGSLL